MSSLATTSSLSARGHTERPGPDVPADRDHCGGRRLYGRNLGCGASLPGASHLTGQAGPSAASNAGIRASHGSFVLRLDADDRLAPTYVEETIAALQREPAAHFAYTKVAYFGAASGTYPVEEFDTETLTERNYVNASALLRRTSFESVGGYRTNPAAVRCEDWDLWLSFAERDIPGVLVAKPLLHYRQHFKGQSTSFNAFNLFSLQGVRREIAMASSLQDYHPRLFASYRLVRRLSRLPRRLMARQITPRFALLLISFYGVMLVRSFSRSVMARPALTSRT